MSGGQRRQMLAYLLAGGCTTAVNFILFLILRLAINESAANAVSVFCSVLFAYWANKRFVFQTVCASRRDLLREMLSFFSARAFTMLLEVGGVFLFAEMLGFDALPVKILLNGLVLVLNFILSKALIFRRKK